ncbi:Transmembrane emp24 domain-containing protein p24beta3 [Linum grandiflorum]
MFMPWITWQCWVNPILIPCSSIEQSMKGEYSFRFAGPLNMYIRVASVGNYGLKLCDFVMQATSPGGNVVKEIKGTSGDKFDFKAPRSGMYKFCFHNPFTTPETVAFYIHVGHIPTENDVAKDEHLDPVNVKIAELREALESVTAEQKYLRARDNRHRHTNESTRKRVIGYTVAEYIALAAVSSLQVLYIRRLFSKSVAYNRV